jgi:large subunit ribosomal protein L9
MKVILRDDVKSVGHMGDVVNVSDGYARNFLIPKNLAVEASTSNIKEFEHYKKTIGEKAAKRKESSQATAGRLAALTVTIRAKVGEEEKLFGSVTSMDIAEALAAEGFEIDKKKIHIPEPIKRVGEYAVQVKLHADVAATVNVHVVPE